MRGKLHPRPGCGALPAGPTGRANARPMTGSASSGGRSGLGPGNVVSAYPRSFPGVCDSPDDLSRPAIARLGSDPGFSSLHIVMGRPWHDIRIVTDAGGHWRNISSELPASVSKWAKSYNSSRSLPPTGQPVSFKRPARYTRAYSRRRSPVSRQSKMTILRPDFLSRKLFLHLDLVGRLVLAALFVPCMPRTTRARPRGARTRAH
jgi:hypothetical protein